VKLLLDWAGEVQSYLGQVQPVALGGPCTGGQGSFGPAVPDSDESRLSGPAGPGAPSCCATGHGGEKIPEVRTLLTVEAVIEGGTGLALVAMPSLVAGLLLGASLDGPGASTVARVAGVALLALVVACWRARNGAPGGAASGVAAALVLYNAGVLAVLVHAATGLGLSGPALWPAVLVHAIMAAWCVTSLGRSTTTPAA